MKKIALLVFALSCFYTSFSQLKQSSSANLIGLEFPPDSTTRVISFDYTNSQYDTLFTINSVIIGGGRFVAFDAYRRILYYVKTTLDSVMIHSKFYSLNMNNQQIDTLFSIVDSGLIIDLQYNPFNNHLIAIAQKVILDYDISSQFYDTLCIIPKIQAIFGPPVNYYNYIDQSYMYQDISSVYSNYKLVKIDLVEKAIDTIFDINSQNAACLTCYNANDDNYYGMINSTKIAKINPTTIQKSIVTNLPNNYNSHLFQQLSVIDLERNLYLLPYLSSNSTPYLSITDINTSICTYIPYRMLHYQFLDNNPAPILKIYQDTLLKGSFHNSYTWYKNGQIISQANMQIFKPSSSGIYKFSTQDIYGNIVYSNEINYTYTNINNEDHRLNINISPNPCQDELHILISNNMRITNYKIYNMAGKELISGKIKYQKTINTSNLPNGIYFLQIENRNYKFIKNN